MPPSVVAKRESITPDAGVGFSASGKMYAYLCFFLPLSAIASVSGVDSGAVSGVASGAVTSVSGADSGIVSGVDSGVVSGTGSATMPVILKRLFSLSYCAIR